MVQKGRIYNVPEKKGQNVDLSNVYLQKTILPN